MRIFTHHVRTNLRTPCPYVLMCMFLVPYVLVSFFIVLSLRHIIFMTQRFFGFCDWFDFIGRRVIDIACASLRTVFTESAPRPLLMCEALAPEL